MSSQLAQAVPLRLSRTHVAADERGRLVARMVAVAAVAFGLWLVAGVQDGALGTLSGLGLVALAPSLARGRSRAHRLACLLAVLATASTIVARASDLAVALGLVALVFLVLTARAFRTPGDPSTRRGVAAAAALATLAALADMAHAGGLLMHPLLGTAVVAAAVLGLRSLRSWRSAPASDAERAAAATLIERYAEDTLAPFALRTDKRYFFAPAGEAFLAYSVVAGVAIVSGDPIGDMSSRSMLLSQFVVHARRHGWVPAALGLSSEQVGAWRALGFDAHYTGDEAIIESSSFSLEGRAIRKVRQSIARLERAGYRVEVRRSSEIDATLAGDLQHVAERWRQGRNETGFSMAFQSAAVDRAREDLYAIAFSADGAVGGFLHLAMVPAGRALSLSGMRRDRSTPNGLNEFLVCSLLAWAAEHGYTRVSLNFAAFAKVIEPPVPADRVTALEQRVLRRLSGRFQLERLLRFNDKFDPLWTPRYMAYPSLAALPRIGLACMLAEAYVVRPSWWRW
jgi:lysyl-tRNA synthetase class 2